MTWVRLDSKVPEHWALLPPLLARIREWGVHFGQENIETHAQMYRAAFVLAEGPQPAEIQQPRVAWVVLNDAGAIVAHLLVEESNYGGRPIAFVNQLVLKPGPVSRATVREVWADAEAWMRSRGLKEAHGTTADMRLAAWHRGFGWDLYRCIIRKEIG